LLLHHPPLKKSETRKYATLRVMDMKITQRSVEDLIPYARNSRTHSDGQVAQIAASIKEFGWTNPILVDGESVVIAGHGRLLAARKLGHTEVPTIELGDLTETQKRAYVIADNRLALDAGWDDEMLALELGEIGDLDFDLDLTGFSADEIAALMPLELEPGLTDEDSVPDVQPDPITKPGDIWLLGKHRVMCGDSTSIDAVEKLMAGQKADLCFTSPPYALGNSASLSGNKVMSKKGNAYTQHKDNADEWVNLMEGWWSASIPYVSAWVVNVQPLAGNKRNLFNWVNDRINQLCDFITWDKGHAAPAMAEGVMSSCFEWMIIFGAENASRSVPFSSWRGTIKNVYSAPPQRSNDFASIHAATMPTHVPEWVFTKLCDKAKSIYEPFAGTGTTLIACEKTGRINRSMELDPKYCDVIVQRWQEFTGKIATNAETGEPFKND
jgi:DNA modification methylase